jgi:hypothetical protein
MLLCHASCFGPNERLRKLEGLRLSDFGTGGATGGALVRRGGHEGLGPSFTGT